MSYIRAAHHSLFDRDISIRPARAEDGARLVLLAQLDSSRPLEGPALVAHVDGEPWAAIDLRDGRAIADPFRPSAGAVRLLRVRAAQLEAGARPAGSRGARWLLRRAGA